VAEEGRDRRRALVLQRHGRHRKPRVAGQQGDQAVDVVGLVGVGEALDQPTFLGGARRGRALLAGAWEALSEGGAGALERALDRVFGGLEHGRGFCGGEAEHVAQKEDRPLVRGQVLQRGDERELDRLPGLKSCLGAG
jgi:hypothetical protein